MADFIIHITQRRTWPRLIRFHLEDNPTVGFKVEEVIDWDDIQSARVSIYDDLNSNRLIFDAPADLNHASERIDFTFSDEWPLYVSRFMMTVSITKPNGDVVTFPGGEQRDGFIGVIPYGQTDALRLSSIIDQLQDAEDALTGIYFQLNPPSRIVLVDHDYINSEHTQWHHLPEEGLTRARAIRTAKGSGRVLIITYFDAVGNPITPAMSAWSGYEPQAADEFIDVRSGITDVLNAESYLNIRVLLEGALPTAESTEMTFSLDSGLLPVRQPYNKPYFVGTMKYHDGNEVMPATATERVATELEGINITDWVLVELRSSVYADKEVHRQAALLRADGVIVNTFGDTLRFPVPAGKYYVVVHHRNHLSVMSRNPVELKSTSGAAITYDFTTSLTQAYGANAMGYRSAAGVYAMYAGDATASNAVGAEDVALQVTQTGQGGYLRSDANLSGGSNAADTPYFTANNGKGTTVPR